MGKALDKKREVGLVLLEQIRQGAEETTHGPYLEQLAHAYALVAEAIPRDPSNGGVVAV